MKKVWQFVANILFVLHALVVLIAVFGWLVASLWYVYMGILVLTLLSDVFFGYCILSKWEFDFRKKINPKTQYDYAWSTYYTYKLTNHRISNRTINRIALTFVVLSLIINILARLI